VKKVHNLFHGSVSKSFAAILQGLREAHRDILHFGMGFFRTTHQKDLVAPGNAFVFILVIETDTEQANNLRFGSRSASHNDSPCKVNGLPLQLYAGAFATVNCKGSRIWVIAEAHLPSRRQLVFCTQN
jgi:hypothetical protein